MKKPRNILMTPVTGYKKIMRDHENSEHEKDVIVNDKPTAFLLKWIVSFLMLLNGVLVLITGDSEYYSLFKKNSEYSLSWGDLFYALAFIAGAIGLHFFFCFRQYNSIKCYGIYIVSAVCAFLSFFAFMILGYL